MQECLKHLKVIDQNATSDNTAYTLRANALALRDIAHYGRNVVYAGNVRRNVMPEADAIMKDMVKCHEAYLSNKRIFLSGNERILQKKKIGVFVSRVIPLNVIIPAEEFLLSLSELPYVFVSGWHSPFERRILKKILSAGKEAIFFTSKGIQNQSLYKYFTKAISEKRLLIVSLSKDMAKVTLHNSIVRNEMIADIAEHNLFVFINKGGNLESLFNKLLNQGKAPLIFNHSANSVFLTKGQPIGLENFKEVLL